MEAIHLRTEQLKDPIGIDIEHPTLSWQCEMGHMQTAWQVLAKIDGQEIWDSEKVENSRMAVMYPAAWTARKRITWQVKLWDENGVEGAWSQEAFFENGILPEHWCGKWIDPEEATEPEVRKPAAYLRKKFKVEKTKAKSNTKEKSDTTAVETGNVDKKEDNLEGARLYATAHGLYSISINGKPVTLDKFTPGSDEYNKRITYQTYDVSSLLVEGENEIRVVLGDGWYRGCNGIDGVRNLFGEDLSFLCQLELKGAAVLVTDETWEASQSGPIRMTDLELGEIYDARMESVASWHPVRVHEFGFEHLVASNCVPVREKEIFEGRLFQTPNGEWVYDFGQNLAGYTRLYVEAQEGDEITLIHGETLDENGNFTIANFQPGDRNQSGGIKQEIHYICREGINSYQPSFSMFGFRYARVVSSLPPEKIRVSAIAVYSDMEETASFASSEKALDQLFQNSVWSMKSNFCDVPTDCPTRERAGWTGDSGVFAPTGTLLMNCYSVFRKWLANVRLNQHEDGKMAYISPTNGKGSQISEMFSASVGWGDASVLVPYALYETFGDVKILKENYEMMKNWVDFLEQRAREQRTPEQFLDHPYKDYIIDTGMDYGEWCEPGSNVMETMQKAFAKGQPEVATAYFSKSAGLLAKIAGILGDTRAQEHYTEISEKAKRAYQSLFVTDGHIHSSRQCEYVRPLAFGLLDSEDEKRAAADLNELVKENQYHLNTGFLSTPYLCEVLTRFGYRDSAYKLLLQRECPGWLYAVERGATTIWETWDGVREDGTVHDSLNHYSYGAISGWLISGVCGIQYDHEKLILAPKPDRSLSHARAVYESPRGKIVSSWQFDGETETFEYHFEIPGNVTAEILLDDGTSKTVTSGVYDL